MSQTGAGERARWIVCIDFGTAFSKAAAVREGAWGAFDPRMVRPLTVGAVSEGGNPFLLESAVFVSDTHVLFGAQAVQEAGAAAASKRQALRSFKTMLSAADFDRALAAFAPLSIDPHRMFTQRDLIVLYLAYLSGAIARAVAVDSELTGAEIRRRYALPAWRGGQSMHARITALFSKAEAVAARLGDALFDPAGIPLATAADALKHAGEPPPLDFGMVFEATAAAAYSLVGLKAPASHLMVLDMCAGTTDFAALGEGGEEIVDARVTLMQAGDMIDRILLDLLLQKAPNLKTQAEQLALWRSLMASIREVKESLFIDGRAAVTHQGKTKTIAARDLYKDRDFKAFSREMKRAFDRSLNAVAARAVKDKTKDVCIVAVGGGAYAPFVQEMVRSAKAPKVRVVSYPATPDWAHSAAFGGNLAPIFPQLAIAIGGALAPDRLCAA